MEVFLYFVEALPCALDEIEDALENAGIGEVTGSGVGAGGSNIDLFANEHGRPIAAVVERIQQTLRPFDVPTSSYMIIDGTKYAISAV